MTEDFLLLSRQKASLLERGQSSLETMTGSPRSDTSLPKMQSRHVSLIPVGTCWVNLHRVPRKKDETKHMAPSDPSTRRVFSGTRLELMIRQSRDCDSDHMATSTGNYSGQK
ncbi:hypothetical protein TNCV_4355711 [Trichonephila clavipes]|nr:hypothetical protein TNCV_4355711 [Trichonephila clavipes]